LIPGRTGDSPRRVFGKESLQVTGRNSAQKRGGRVTRNARAEEGAGETGRSVKTLEKNFSEKL